MICLEESQLINFIEGSFDSTFWSEKIQNLLKQYAKDIIASMKAVNEIPKSYFEGVSDIDKEKNILVKKYTENIMDKLGEGISDELIQNIRLCLGRISA